MGPFLEDNTSDTKAHTMKSLIGSIMAMGALCLCGCREEPSPLSDQNRTTQQAESAKETNTAYAATILFVNERLPETMRNYGWGTLAVNDENKTTTLTLAKDDLNRQDADGMTMLARAAAEGMDVIVKALLENGADVNARCRQNTTALHYAVAHEESYAIKALLNHKANPNLADDSGWTALWYAVDANHPKWVKHLITAGADPEHRETKSGTHLTPLMHAAWHGNFSALEALLEANVDVNATDDRGATALLHAADEGRLKTCERLLTAGANPNAASKEGLTALLLAAASDNTPLVTLLLRHGADPDLKTYQGKSPRDIAKEHNATDCLKAMEPKP